MSDLDQRFDKVEQQLQVIVNSQSSGVQGNLPSPKNDEIDLRELWDVLWVGKWWVIGITFSFAVVGVLYALSLPNMYKSEGIYAPAQSQGGSPLGGQFGGLAAIAGISLGGSESSDIDQAMAQVSSWPFLEVLINKHDLKKYIFGVNGWDVSAQVLVWNDEVYERKTNTWLRKPKLGESAEPTSYATYKKFRKMLNVSFDAKKNLLNISVEFYSPVLAKEWVDLIARELNYSFQIRDSVESQANIDYLESQIEQTVISEMRTVFYEMIEAQLKTLMLTEVSDAYLIKNVVKPKVAELKSGPKRALILLGFIMFGGVCSCGVVLWRSNTGSMK